MAKRALGHICATTSASCPMVGQVPSRRHRNPRRPCGCLFRWTPWQARLRRLDFSGQGWRAVRKSLSKVGSIPVHITTLSRGPTRDARPLTFMSRNWTAPRSTQRRMQSSPTYWETWSPIFIARARRTRWRLITFPVEPRFSSCRGLAFRSDRDPSSDRTPYSLNHDPAAEPMRYGGRRWTETVTSGREWTLLFLALSNQEPQQTR